MAGQLPQNGVTNDFTSNRRASDSRRGDIFLSAWLDRGLQIKASGEGERVDRRNLTSLPEVDALARSRIRDSSG